MCQPHGVLKKLIFYMRKRDKSKHTLCVCVYVYIVRIQWKKSRVRGMRVPGYEECF